MASQRLARKIVFSGIQPTGFIHLGNYLGAVQNWVKLQEDPSINERLFCVVDYHAITQKYVGVDVPETTAGTTMPEDAALVKDALYKEGAPDELTLKTAATLLACGINPQKSTLFVQSHVPAHTEMQWLLSALTPLSWLNKMIQFKEKKTANDKYSSLSLYSYPVLMAADILMYQATHVPVGEDQTQHLELSRDIAERYNRIFGDLFPQPQQLVFENSLYQCNRVMSLSNASRKMSKSDKSQKALINLIDDPEMIRLKIRKAKTDAHGTITYDPAARPELANLLRIYCALEGIKPSKVEPLFEDDNMFSFKEKLSNKLIDKICPIGDKALELCSEHEDMLLDIVDQGAKKANEQAERTLQTIKRQVGILRRL